MEELFSSNLFAIYIIACIAIISYSNFRENQRMFLLYILTFATAFFQIFRIIYSIILLHIITFVFLEYLTEDNKKISLITKFTYKVYDYIFMLIFQYHFLWIFFAFLMLHFSHYDMCSVVQILLKIASIVSVFIGAHLSISQPFKIKSITEMCQKFEEIPPYSFEYNDNMQEKFDLLCSFEDKTYFQRKKSYSCATIEYIVCYTKSNCITVQKILHKALSCLKKSYRKHMFSRGYSTPEMQLLRTIGIARGYDKYKKQRKIFEIVYSKIFFSSLKKFHEANTYLPLPHYRHYLLYVYFQTVMTKINEKKCIPLSSAFKETDISNWSMNGLFVACLGLSFRKVNDKSIKVFADIIEKFKLDTNQIKKLSENYPEEKF